MIHVVIISISDFDGTVSFGFPVLLSVGRLSLGRRLSIYTIQSHVEVARRMHAFTEQLTFGPSPESPRYVSLELRQLILGRHFARSHQATAYMNSPSQE